MRTAVLSLACLSLVACGGSSGGGGGLPAQSPTLFSGEYTMAASFFRVGDDRPVPGPIGPGPEILSRALVLPSSMLIGSAVSDGGGTVTQAGMFNYFGSISTAPPTDTTYEIQAGNRFFFGENARGGISTDGRVAGAIFGQGGIGVWGNHEPVTTDADAAGSYRFALLMDSPTGPELQAFVGVCTLDGAGGVSFGSELANVEGTVIPTGTANGVYAVASQGRIELELGSGLSLIGSMAYGGELLVFGGGIGTDQPPCILLMIRQATGLTPDVFGGSYFAFGHEFRLGLPPVLQSSATFEGEVTADGAGIADLTYEERIVDDAPAPAASQFGTYTLAPDGELEVEWDFQTLRGAITGDGEVAILGGGTGDGDRPTLIVLIRKPE